MINKYTSGYADLVFGGVGNATTPSLGYAAFVSYGNQSGTINLATPTTGISGFAVRGNSYNTTVSAAGDVNGDGLTDFMVSQASNTIYDGNGNPTGQYTGTTWVVYGNTNRTTDLQLGSMTISDGFTVAGGAAGIANFGARMSQAGDFNGDGYDDVLVGTQSGSAYMVYGGAAAGGTTIDPLTGAFKFSSSIGALAGGGDINGDGRADVAVHQYNSNVVNVVYGTAGYAAGSSLDVTTMGAAAGFAISGLSETDGSAFIVANAGDVNGDGFDDLLVGSALHHRAFVIYGGATGVNVDVTTLTDAQGFSIEGTENATGGRVSAAGDVNGDGLADLMMAVTGTQNVVIYGGNSNAGVVLTMGTDAADTLTGDASRNSLLGAEGNDTLTGGGGTDVLYGGQGHDTVVINDNNVVNINAAGARIDGGFGFDTLALDGSGITLNFSNIGYNKVIGVERIDLTGSGNNSLVLNLQDLVNLSDISNVLRVEGNAGDSVTLSGGTTLTTPASGTVINVPSATGATLAEGLLSLTVGADTDSDGILEVAVGGNQYNVWYNANGTALLVDTDVTAVISA